MVASATIGAMVGGGLLATETVLAERRYLVSFGVSGEERDLATGYLPFDDYAAFDFEIASPQLVMVTARMEWDDQSNTPIQNPYVNLVIDSDSGYGAIDEIPRSGGSVKVDVPNPLPADVIVFAHTEEDAIRSAMGPLNNTTAGIGSWWIMITTQAPSDFRPFFSGGISYRVWLTLTFYEAIVERVD
jgi:hypothetical protein